jgi:hypothetical protein
MFKTKLGEYGWNAERTLAVISGRCVFSITGGAVTLGGTSSSGIAIFRRRNDLTVSAVDGGESGTSGQNVGDTAGSVGEGPRSGTSDTSGNGQGDEVGRELGKNFVDGARPVTGRGVGKTTESRAGSHDVSIVEATRGCLDFESSEGSQERNVLERSAPVKTREGNVKSSLAGLSSHISKRRGGHRASTPSPMEQLVRTNHNYVTVNSSIEIC